MTNAKHAWEDLGTRLESLGLKLKLHLEQANTDEVRSSLRKLGDAIDDAFEALGSAVRDDAVRQDLRDGAEALANAIGATFASVGDEVRSAVQRRRSGSGTA